MWSKAEFVEGATENQVTFCQDHGKITVETHVHSVQTECNRCTNISLVAREPRSQTGSVCRLRSQRSTGPLQGQGHCVCFLKSILTFGKRIF